MLQVTYLFIYLPLFNQISPMRSRSLLQGRPGQEGGSTRQQFKTFKTAKHYNKLKWLRLNENKEQEQGQQKIVKNNDTVQSYFVVDPLESGGRH